MALMSARPFLTTATLTVATAALAAFQALADSDSPLSLRGGTTAVSVDPERVLTAEACLKCHPNEVQVWKQTPHHQTFQQMHRRPEATEIAQRLGIQSIKYEGRCVACHYTQQQQQDGIVAVSGVSCESCHGAASDWLEVHHDYGSPEQTRETETPEHRIERLKASVARGMRNPHNVYHMAQSCYRCHTVPDEELVNVGGHSAGSLEFEFVAWSQGTVRHNFLSTPEGVNRPSSSERLLKMFACGLVADLEFSLRATAVATKKDVFGITSARRAARAAARIQSAYAKTNNRYLGGVMAVYDAAELKINNETALTLAADRVASIGLELAADTAVTDLTPLAEFVPSEDRWK